MKTTVNFIDKNHNRVTVTAETTTRNGYLEFTASGEIGGCLGQIRDEIEPANDSQAALLAFWRTYHLKEVTLDLEDEVSSLMADIQALEDERKGEPLKLEDRELIELIETVTDFSGDDAEFAAALVKMFDLSENDLGDIKIDGTRVTVQGIDYLAGTDDQMDKAWDEELDNYLEECVYPELPEGMKCYFDDEKWKRDARIDGRGHALNRYDGGEEFTTVEGVYYYAYRQ